MVGVGQNFPMSACEPTVQCCQIRAAWRHFTLPFQLGRGGVVLASHVDELTIQDPVRTAKEPTLVSSINVGDEF